MRIKTGDQAIDDPEEFWEDSIGRALDKFAEGRGLERAAEILGLSKAECAERVALLKNCGTGSGGFQPGNTCARGGDGGREESLRASGLDKLLAEKTSAPADLTARLSASQVARGISALSAADDKDVASAIHKDVYAKLGELRGSSDSVEVKEDGRTFVRRTYEYADGRMLLERDENGLLATVHQKGSDGVEREVVKFRVRDRRLDGTPDADQPPLTDWAYSNPALDSGGAGAVELSLYVRQPGTFWAETHPGEMKFEEFLRDPFERMTDGFKGTLEIGDAARAAFESDWMKAFDNAGLLPREGETRHPDARAPAQNGLPYRGAGRALQDRGEGLARDLGYARVDNVPSWYNVAVFLENGGYKYARSEDAEMMGNVKQALRNLNARREAAGEKRLTSLQESWVVLLQYGRDYGYTVPAEFDLGGAKMPLAMGRNLWMTKGIK